MDFLNRDAISGPRSGYENGRSGRRDVVVMNAPRDADERNQNLAPGTESQVRILKHKYRIRKVGFLTMPNQDCQLDFAGPIESKTRGDVYLLVATDLFSEWPITHL